LVTAGVLGASLASFVSALAVAHRVAAARDAAPWIAGPETVWVPTQLRGRQTQQVVDPKWAPQAPQASPPARALAMVPANIRINDPAGETFGTGDTQMEPSIAAHGDTLLCGFTDSRGLWGSGTLSGFAWSLDGGQTWTDGGSLPSPGWPTLTYGDPTVATDFQGRWYYVSELDRGNGAGGPGTGGLSVVLHRAWFAGPSLVWDAPFVVAGTPSERLDTAHLAVDPDRDRVYVAFTNVTLPNGQIEVVTLDQRGTHVLHRVVVQPQVTGVNHAGTRVAVGPNGEVYCVFQGGVYAGSDGQGPGTQKIVRSLDFGATFSTPVVAATIVESWLSGPPGANREEEFVEFPSVAVDRSFGPHRGRVYIAWHDAVQRSFTGTLMGVTETGDPNGSPQDAQLLPALPPTNFGWSIGGNLATNDYGDWYRFTGQAGDHMRMIVNPAASMLSMRLVLRCANSTGGGADTTLAASTRSPGAQVFFMFSLPNDGAYYVGLSRLDTVTGGYQAFLRRAGSTTPSTAIDHRDVVLVSSPDGVAGWSPKVRVHDDTGFTDQVYPEVVVDGAGGVHVAWYDRRWDPHCRALADLALASSFDAGATFSPAARLTTGSSWWEVSADAVPNFGDQFRPAAVGERLHVAWADGRRGDPDVMFAPLRTDFELALPESAHAIPGQVLPVAGTLRNRTPYDGALFTVRVQSDHAALPDSAWVVGPVAAGADVPLLYEPIVGSGIQGPWDVHFEVECNRSAFVRSDVVVAYNDVVAVWLQELTAHAGADGVRLEWRASATARFHVQRAATARGPFATMTTAPLVSDAAGRFTFHDAQVAAGEVWFYRLAADDAAGDTRTFGPYRVAMALPARLALAGAVPNPFNPSTEIRFTLPRDGAVTLRIIDARGRRVATLVDGEHRKPGLHAVGWDGRDARGVPQASGVYWAELSSQGKRAVTRLVLVR
jgi:hypothetical protein